MSIAFKKLRGSVGFYLGYGRGADNDETPTWSLEQESVIDEIVASGMRQFYYPFEQKAGTYDWSFLRPVANLYLASGASTLDLPDDFGGIEGNLYIVDASKSTYGIPITGMVRAKYAALPSSTGMPQMATVEAKKGIEKGQRWQLVVWPIADAAYTLQATYYINPDYLSGTKPYAYGGTMHAETLLESCLAVAETRLNDTAGIHQQLFQQRLAASMAMDRRDKPIIIGYNGDWSDSKREISRRDIYAQSQITFNGTLY